MILALLVFWPFVGALICYVAGRKWETTRDCLADFVVITEFVMGLWLFIHYAGTDGNGISFHMVEVCALGLEFTIEGFRIEHFRDQVITVHDVAEGFRLIYVLVMAFMWMMTVIFSREYMKHHSNKNRFYTFMLLTLGATMGVFLSADLITTFVFFEIMSFTSYVWVAQEETKGALKAASTYLAVSVIGGLVMLMGIFLLYYKLGTVNISRVGELLTWAYICVDWGDKGVLYAAGLCLLVGFGAKAGAFPLHIWLPRAHPAAPAPASALLSGILTKAGIFGVLVVSCDLFLGNYAFGDYSWSILMLAVGVPTMFGGALLAVFSIDLKRTLACSSMSQIGFILVGVGMQGLLWEEGNLLAVHGTFLHMLNHSLIKLVLFMAAGVIFVNTHALDLNEIRGYGRKKPLLKAIFLTGALAIGGIPFFGGYISKTLLHESIVEYGGGLWMVAVEWIFLLSGGLTLAYMTKLFMAIFVEKNTDPEKQAQFDQKKPYMNIESTLALSVSALVLLVWGLFPHGIMEKAARLGEDFMHYIDRGEAAHAINYFSLENLKGAFISTCIGIFVYLVIIRYGLTGREKDGSRIYIDRLPKWLDLEKLIYRPVLLELLPAVCGVICRIFDSFTDLVVVALRKTLYKDSPIPHERVEGNLATELAGRFLNMLQRIRNKSWGRKHPTYEDYTHILAAKSEEFVESTVIIGRSVSFGLLMFAFGLVLTLIYIISW